MNAVAEAGELEGTNNRTVRDENSQMSSPRAGSENAPAWAILALQVLLCLLYFKRASLAFEAA
ncbi:hypothetical protein [Pseudomonas guariconensis]|uniref:hypothetical protein n=1 Tax=Pseudomonas guariconensis TaxID=1288410 RepID=UPI0018AC170F|nr:hypothetical protein [Pseudomonas guariconensis]MBF8720154.1 hypothetical protein [Pseudomonas guariconensis]MBF8792705.1 hypothetical protein [Pseudomonas monteilii]